MTNGTILRAKAVVLGRRAQKLSDAIDVIESIEREDGLAYDLLREGLKGILEKIQHEVHLLYPQVGEVAKLRDGVNV
jgi:hypothetical protein